MKVLWLSHFVPYPPTGGALQRSFHLLRHAASQHEVHLLALHQPRLLPTSDLPNSIAELSRLCASVRVFHLFAERSAVHRLANVALSVGGTAPFDVVWLRNRQMKLAVDAARQMPHLSLVHADTIGLWPYVDRSNPTAAPIVLGHHNVESELIARRAAQEGSAWRAALLRNDARKLAALERAAAPNAAVNLVVSQLDATRLQSIVPGAAVEVVENGVDIDYWQPDANPSASTTLIFAGTLGWYPNRDAVDFLVTKIWPALLETRADRRLILVGRDPSASARAAAADSRVEVTGFVPDVRPYMRSAGIYVCPIRVGGGTRLKVLDALAMAKPLVATAIAVEGLDLVDGQHYLRAETVEEFVAQITRLEQSPDLSASLGAAGRRFVVERFSWQVIGKQLDAGYARALATREPQPVA